MTKPKSIKHHTLIVALLALAAALVIRHFLIDENEQPIQYHQQIVEKLHSELGEVSNQLQQIVRDIRDAKDFSDYQQESDYPYFVFSEDSIIYWSDFHYVPDYQVLSPTPTYKYISDKGLQYIAQEQLVPGSQRKNSLYNLANL